MDLSLSRECCYGYEGVVVLGGGFTFTRAAYENMKLPFVSGASRFSCPPSPAPPNHFKSRPLPTSPFIHPASTSEAIPT